MSLSEALHTLSVFRHLKDDPVVAAFYDLVDKADRRASAEEVRAAYAEFAGLLYDQYTTDWTGYLRKQVLDLQTCCTHFAALDNEVPRYMLDAAMNELSILSAAAALSPENFFSGGKLPRWSSYQIDLQGEYLNRLINITKRGYGMYANHTMFRLAKSDQAPGFQLVPVLHPDPVQFSDLIGYESQHQIVIDNTQALLEGAPASNVLLYGAAGTGKSATVKAVVNAFAKDGLRLIEIGKDQLPWLPSLLDELADNPLKFILFIDDLSFQDNDDNFSALKAVLEGSVSRRAANTVMYATSNRRHIVRETFSARSGDEVHRNDTMQETISLSERFGIRILFDKPNLEEYSEIVLGLAKQAGLDADQQELTELAERFVLRKGGRSARAARQFIDQAMAARKEEESQC